MRQAFYVAHIVCCLYVITGLSGCKKEFIYNTTGIYLQNYDNSGSYMIPAGSAVNGDAFVLRLMYTSDLTDYYSVDDNNDYHSDNNPTSISINCLQNFDSLHPANSSVADCFINGPGTTSVQNVVDYFYNTQNYYPTHEPDDLWLMKAPAAPGTYSFVVRMVFDNGLITTDTSTVNLN